MTKQEIAKLKTMLRQAGNEAYRMEEEILALQQDVECLTERTERLRSELMREHGKYMLAVRAVVMLTVLLIVVLWLQWLG